LSDLAFDETDPISDARSATRRAIQILDRLYLETLREDPDRANVDHWYEDGVAPDAPLPFSGVLTLAPQLDEASEKVEAAR
jgi:hypothetical protein